MNIRGKIFQNISLRKYLILLSVFLLAVVLLIVSFILYSDIDERIKAQTAEIGSVKFRQYTEYVDENFGNLDKLASYMVKDKSLLRILMNYERNIMSDINKKTQVEAYLAKLSSEYDFISSINITSTEKEHFYYGNIVFSQDVISNLEMTENPIPAYSIKEGSLLMNIAMSSASSTIDDLDQYMYMYFSLGGNENKVWNVWIILNRKLFFRDNEDIESTAFIDKGEVLYEGFRLAKLDPELIDNTNLDDKKGSVQIIDDTRMYSQKFADADLTGVYAVDAGKYMNKLKSIKISICLIYLFSLIIAFAASEYISGKIIKPVNELNKLMSGYNLAGVANQATRRKNKKSFSMREKVFYYMLITILIPVAFYMFVFFYQSNHVMNELVKNYYESVYTKTSKQLNRNVENKISLLQKLSFDSNVQNYLVNNENINYVVETVENMRYIGLNKDAVSLYDSNGKFIFSDRYRSNDWIGQGLQDSLKSAKLGVSYNITQDEIGDIFLSLSMPIIYLEDGEHKSDRIGFCRIDLEYYRLENTLSILKDAGCKVGISDSKGNLVFEDGKRIFDEQLNLVEKEVNLNINGVDGRLSVYCSRIPGTSLYLVAWFNLRDMVQQTRTIILNYIYLFVVILLITVILSHFISMNLLKPIGELSNAFKSYDIYGSYFEENYFIDEINNLGENFNQMADRIETLVDDLIITSNEKNKVELARKSAEITALQAQINPHFLYNTLNNLIALIRTGSYDEAVLTVKLLSRLFKYGISREEIIIPIREEIEYAKAYTQIMKIRHRDRISFEWDIKEEALDCLTIKLILQPLIENSIRHGFNIPDKKGTVFIRCREDDKDIVFDVEDNGTGIPEEELESIIEELDEGAYGNKIGIYNVQSRLRLHYGRQYGLKLSSTYGKGTLVTVRIPKKSGTTTNPKLVQ